MIADSSYTDKIVHGTGQPNHGWTPSVLDIMPVISYIRLLRLFSDEMSILDIG
jgi:hypothetical protein